MRNAVAKIIFWLHLVIVGVWFGLTLVPASWWSAKITFHFFLSIAIVFHQYVWGAVLLPWSKHYGPACILTTFMQWARGIKISDPRNFRHSWTKEFTERMGFRIPTWGATLLPLSILFLSTLQYFISR